MIAEVSWGEFSTHCPVGTPQIPDYEITEAEALNNAHLIAAAPDLLEALEDMLAQASGTPKRCEHEYDCICPNDNARAAIKKARWQS
jgi:hypothetical protein